MSGEANCFIEMSRSLVPCYLFISLILLIAISPTPVWSANEFTVYRMSQFDSNGITFGCRSSSVSLEAKSVYSWSTNRHCVIADINDLTISMFDEISSKAGGLVVMLPKNASIMSFEDREKLASLENYMISQTINIPVYFTHFSNEMKSIVDDLNGKSRLSIRNQTSDYERVTGFSNFLTTISANTYQIIVSGSNHAPRKDSRTPIIQGELQPINLLFKSSDANEMGSRSPTIILTAQLKPFGLYNEYQYNSDVAVLLSIADIFNKLYGSKIYFPKYRLIFLITESGSLLNFHGTKKWLEEYLTVQNVDFILCLDNIVESLYNSDNEIFMHVSKPPREGTTINNFYKLLKTTALKHNRTNVEGIHKKINLNDRHLQWEHERFVIKRYSAFTLSSMKSSKMPSRHTIFKADEKALLQKTHKVANIIIEALAHYVYKSEIDGKILSSSLVVKENLLKGYLNVKSLLQNNDLKYLFEKYLQNVKMVYDKVNMKDPEFMFYEGQESKLNVYRVKPAVFDLLLTLLISCYLTLMYFAIQLFPKLYNSICSMTCSTEVHQNIYTKKRIE